MTDGIAWEHPIDTSDQWDGFNDEGMEHFTGSPLKNVAREVNQNSSDAADGGLVRVTMRLIEVDTNSIPNFDQLKNTINLCAAVADKESEKARLFFDGAKEILDEPKLQVLEISDFNTTGMLGPSVNGTPFYAYMKAKGQSRKTSETAGGSFGIGKFAPFVVSKLRTVFISTVFEGDDGEYYQLTQGKSILMSHDDASGNRRQGTGYWGVSTKCQPVDGVSEDIPAWIQRANSTHNLKEHKGSRLTILGFDGATGWQKSLAASVAENFFGAIYGGKLEVEIDDKFLLNKDSIASLFSNQNVREHVLGHKNEPEQFDNCERYLLALGNSPDVIVEESQTLHLGRCQIRLLLGKDFPKKVCILRNGMFITDSLSQAGLKNFSDFKDFVAVVECLDTNGIELLRKMEPARHDSFDVERLPSAELKKKGLKALKDLAKWIRDVLKDKAKNPVTEVTSLDELKEFFPDESGDGDGKGTEEIDPNGKITLRAKPLKPKSMPAPSVQNEIEPSQLEGDGGAGSGGQGEEGEGGGGQDGGGGGDGQGGQGGGEGGSGGADSKKLTKTAVAIENIRSITKDGKTRSIFFTPVATGRVAIRVLGAGADVDYDMSVITSNAGEIDQGAVILEVTANKRVNLEIGLTDEFKGALKVVAHEI